MYQTAFFVKKHSFATVKGSKQNTDCYIYIVYKPLEMYY